MTTSGSRLPAPVPISQHRWPTGTKPLVSVLCTAYNHERFVRQAIEGFLSQETDFPVEIVLHDDASSDGTSSIIREYAGRYPSLIRAILQTENQRSRGRWAIAMLMETTPSEYFAICEGDDYWTAADKLQSQIELLEQNPTASACFHRGDGLFEESGRLIPGHFGPSVLKDSYDVDDLLVRDNFVPTHSVVLRSRSIAGFPQWLAEVPHCDIVLLCMLTLEGPLFYLDRSMGVYRKHSGGMHTGDPEIIQNVKVLITRLRLGYGLGVVDRDAFRSGIAYTVAAIEDKLERYERRIAQLEARHASDAATIQRIFASTTFRVGMTLSRLRHWVSRGVGAAGE